MLAAYLFSRTRLVPIARVDGPSVGRVGSSKQEMTKVIADLMKNDTDRTHGPGDTLTELTPVFAPHFKCEQKPKRVGKRLVAFVEPLDRLIHQVCIHNAGFPYTGLTKII